MIVFWPTRGRRKQAITIMLIYSILTIIKKKMDSHWEKITHEKKMTVSIHSPAAITHSVQFLINTANQLITWPDVMRTAEWGMEKEI